jgi:hypothetical protein
MLLLSSPFAIAHFEIDLTARELHILQWCHESGGLTDDQLEVHGECGDGHVIDRLEELGLVRFDGGFFKVVWN